MILSQILIVGTVTDVHLHTVRNTDIWRWEFK